MTSGFDGNDENEVELTISAKKQNGVNLLASHSNFLLRVKLVLFSPFLMMLH